MNAFRIATSWVLIRHLYAVQIETWCHDQGEERIIIKSWRQEEHPANRNKKNCHITRCHVDN